MALPSPEATLAFGERIGRTARGGLVLALRGGLGAGKTLLTKGIARGLGVEDEVTSPTYTIVSEYEGRLRLHHIDAYRLAGSDEFEALGGREILSDRGGIAVIEWSERIEDALPSEAVGLELLVEEGDRRRVVLAGSIPPEWVSE